MDKFQENQWESNEINKNKLRHRQSDARWRANLANCYSELKKLLGNEDVLNRKKATKAVVLKEMIQHILCMENTLEKLLKKKANHDGLESEQIPEKYTLIYYKNEFKKQEENRKIIRGNIKKTSLRNNRNKFKKNSSILILKALQNSENEVINNIRRSNFPLLTEKYSDEDHCYCNISSEMEKNQELSSFLDNWEDLKDCGLNSNEKKDSFIAETKINKINQNNSNPVNKITNKKYSLNNIESTSEVFAKSLLKDTSPKKSRIIENFSTPINRFWSDRNLFSCPATPTTSPYKRSPCADKTGFHSYSEPKRRRKYLTEVRRNILEKIETSGDETNCINIMHHSFENKSQLTNIEKNSSANVSQSVFQNSNRNQFKENLHKPIKRSVRRGLENLMNNINSKNKTEDNSEIMFSQSQEPDISFTKLISQANIIQNNSAIYSKCKTKYINSVQSNESLFKDELNIMYGTKYTDVHQISNLQNEEKERELLIQNFKQEELFETPPNLLNITFDSEQFTISPKTWSNIVSPLSIKHFEENKENNCQQDIIMKFNDLFASNKFDPELFFDKWYKSIHMDCIDNSESSVLQETKQNYDIDQDESTFEYLSNYMKQIDLLNLEETCQEVPADFSLQCNIKENNQVPEKLNDYSSTIADNSNFNDKIIFEDQEVPKQGKYSVKEANCLKFCCTDNATFIPFQKMENNSNLIDEVPDIYAIPQSNFSKISENLKSKELNKQENIHMKNNVHDNSHNYLIQEQDPILTSANFSINQLKLTGSKHPNFFWHSPKNQSNPNCHYNECFWSPCKDFSSVALFDI